MLRFFADFTPLSVVGANFFRRLNEAWEEDYLLVRNLPFGFELEQEYLYRALYAIVNGRTVIYEDAEYIPVRIEYRKKDMMGMKEKLYLLAGRYTRSGSKGQPGKLEYLELSNGFYLAPGERTLDKEEKIIDILEVSSPVTEVLVDFYYNSKTDYLIRRRREGWKSSAWMTISRNR